MNLINILFAVLAAGVFGFFAFNLKKNWSYITTTGKGQEEDRFDQIPLRIKNMLLGGLLQLRMFREPNAAIMHFMIFWGFVTVSLGTLESLVHGIYSPFSFATILGNDTFLYNAYSLSQDIGNCMVALATFYAILRRIFFPPTRLATLAKDAKKDALVVLSLIFLLVTTALVYMGAKTQVAEGLPASYMPISHGLSNFYGSLFGIPANENGAQTWILIASWFWWIHMLVLFSFTSFLPYSKHQHLLWVWPNMLFKSLKSTGRLRPMVFDEEAESFGVGETQAFTWKQLLDGMTCVECGRCTSQCPAYNTGKSLDPRLMIHHLKDAMMESVKGGDNKKDLIGGIVSQEELWACTTCGACMEACPLHIEHIPAIVDMRRYLTMTEGEMPEELQTTLQNLETQGNPWGMGNESRADWAKGLPVTTMAEKEDVEYLFWVGCAGSFDDRYKKVSQSIANILDKANISFSILGTEETCNGDTARRVGNEYLADMQIKENIETMQRYKVKKVVTGCPHCFNTIKNEYPDFGFKPEVIHHSELISKLIREKKISPKTLPDGINTMTYHDSCYLGRHNKIYDSPRESIGQFSDGNLIEMKRSKDKGFCCGAGGGRMWMEETVGKRVNVERAEEAIATGADTVATACPFCMTMMQDGVTEKKKETDVQVKDIAEIVSASLD